MSQAEDFNLAKALREKLREVEDRLARNANKSPVPRGPTRQEMADDAGSRGRGLCESWPQSAAALAV